MSRQQFESFVTSVFCLVCLIGCQPQQQSANPIEQSANASSLDKEIEEVMAQMKALDERLHHLKAEREKLAGNINLQVLPSQNAFTAGKDLFAKLPVDAYPKLGDKFQIERAATLKWIERNLVGSVVTWQEKLAAVTVEGHGPFSVHLKTQDVVKFGPRHALGQRYLGFGEPFLVSEVKSQVLLSPVNTDVFGYRYELCTVEEAKKLRDLENQNITLKATIVDLSRMKDLSEKFRSWYSDGHAVGFKYGTNEYSTDDHDGKEVELVPIRLAVSAPEINGFMPAEMKAATEKITSR